MGFDADVAVVGLGALGSHAAWRLAGRGQQVIGFEQFCLGHDRGSSHGLTRLFRVACLEHPNLVTMARRSRALWHELQTQSVDPILEITGGIMIGPPKSAVVLGTLTAAQAHDLPVELLTRAQLTERFPQHQDLSDDTVGIWDPEAGIVYPETAIRVAVAAAERAGATIYTDTKVVAIEPSADRVVVKTATSSVTARQVVVTTGAWLSALVPELELTPMRTPMTWFRPIDAHGDSFDLENFPVFVRVLDQGNGIWGHGAVNGCGVKVGPDHDPTVAAADPDCVDRSTSENDHALVSELLNRALPGLDPEPSRIVICMVTHSRDGQFVVGRPHPNSRLVVGGGDSGHAFKHAPGLGELIAQIITGEPTYVGTAFIDPQRLSHAARMKSR